MKQRMVSFSLIGFLTLGVVCLMIAGTPHTIASGSALTATASPIPTLIPAGTSNTVWTPLERDFDGVTMVLVPPGCFMMGSSEEQIDYAFELAKQYASDAKREWFDYEKPVHEVCLDQPFWIDQTEVTQAQFKGLGGKAANASYFIGDNLPRENITWFEAWDFCAVRGARLPTEAEWEYAARGPESLIYPWGNTFDGNRANYCDSNCEPDWKDKAVNDGYRNTASVGSYLNGASWVGALDMSGNVWEWVNSLYQPYPYKANDGRESTSDTNSTRVLRGGGWYSYAYVLRAAFRGGSTPDFRNDFNGFRCVRASDNETSLAVPPPAPTAIAAAVTPIPSGTSNHVWTPQTQDFSEVTMVLVPAGCFMMGSGSGESDEKPVYEVCFDQPFWIDQTEVTQAQFKGLGGKATRASSFTGDNRPVEQITWFEAWDFCAVRGARLPSEAEWEYAARGPESLIYPWGNTFVANNVVYDGNSDIQTANVGSHPGGVSWVGALDMSGNVWEWTNSIIFSYPYKADDGRESADDITSARVLRGAAWSSGGNVVHAANRNWDTPHLRGRDIGFRCARSYN